MAANRILGTLASFGTPSPLTKYVRPDSITLEGNNGGWGTIATAQYAVAPLTGQLVQRYDSVYDWSVFSSFRVTYTVVLSGVPTTYTAEAITFAAEVDDQGNPAYFSPIGPVGEIYAEILYSTFVQGIIYAQGGEIIGDLRVTGGSIIAGAGGAMLDAQGLTLLASASTYSGLGSVKFAAAGNTFGDIYELYNTTTHLHNLFVLANSIAGYDSALTLIAQAPTGKTASSAITAFYDASHQAILAAYATSSDFYLSTTGRLIVQMAWGGSSATNLLATFDSYGDATRMVVRRANGTIASPTKILNTNPLGSINYRGWDDSGAWSLGVVSFIATATEDWNDATHHGANLTISTTAAGSATAATRVTIDENNMTLAVPIAMGSHKITGIAAGAASGDAFVHSLNTINQTAAPTADFSMNSHKFTSLAAGAAAGEAASFDQIKSPSFQTTGMNATVPAGVTRYPNNSGLTATMSPLWIAQDAGKLSGFYCEIDTGQPAGGTLVYTLYSVAVGGALSTTGLVITVAAGGARNVYSDTAHTYTCAAGEMFTVGIKNNDGANASGQIGPMSVRFSFV